MGKKFLHISLLIVLLFFIAVTNARAQSTIRGIVADSVSGEPVPYAAVYLKETSTGTTTDENGRFILKTKSGHSGNLVISTVGYIEKRVAIHAGKEKEMRIMLQPTTYQLSEIVVKPKKEKYSRKDNPAVEFVKKAIESRNLNSPKNQPYYQNEHYEKLTFALNDFSDKQREKWLFKKFQFIFDYVDTSEVSGKPILTVSVKEKLANSYFRQSPSSQKEVVRARKQAGFDDIFSKEGIQAFIHEVFKDVDPFQNDISLFINRFVSPLSTIGPTFYKYYILDTVDVSGESCLDLGFVPFNSESFGFTGHLYITLDSTYFVKRMRLNVPKDINLNFVENMTIDQEYNRTPDGTRLLMKDDMTVEFKIAPNTQGLYARRTVSYKDHSFTPPDDPQIFLSEQQIIENADAEAKPEAYWEDNRHNPIKQKENAVERLMERLRENPIYYYTEKVISILISGYLETSEKGSKFDFGPMNTTISGNTAEGVRLRAGGVTTAYLNKHLFGGGYVAYGTKDGKFKYSAQAEYSFNEKKEHPNEFPIHSVKASYSYDINQLGQHYLYTNKDNVFLSLKRKNDNVVTYLRKAEFDYRREHYSGLSYSAGIRYQTEYATKYVPFLQENGLGETYPVKDYSMGELEVRLRYAPNEKYYQTKSQRIPITVDAPIFTLSHTTAHKGILGTDYNYNRTEFGFQKRFWFSAFGYTDITIKAGKVWDKVPFPLLIIPNANLSYTIQDESYSLMNPMEFLNDQYASWDITYYMNGALFNRIPLLKYLKWRELITFKGLYGHLGDRNNPSLSSGLFQFPAQSYAMGKIPYMEAGIGIENIFKILRVDYVWRLTYRDHPHVSKGGLRISLHFTF